MLHLAYSTAWNSGWASGIRGKGPYLLPLVVTVGRFNGGFRFTLHGVGGAIEVSDGVPITVNVLSTKGQHKNFTLMALCSTFDVMRIASNIRQRRR